MSVLPSWGRELAYRHVALHALHTVLIAHGQARTPAAPATPLPSARGGPARLAQRILRCPDQAGLDPPTNAK